MTLFVRSELQNIEPEVGPSSPNFSLSVFEKLSRYGALSDIEHVGLLVGKETLAARLLKRIWFIEGTDEGLRGRTRRL